MKSVIISEVFLVGFLVIKVFVVDLDYNFNGKVFYLLIFGVDGKFEIGRGDGVICVIGDLDWEMKEGYVLNVLVLDGSYYLLEGFGIVFVILLDVNDNILRFDELVYKVIILEEFLVGSLFVNFIVNDLDYGINFDIFYFMNYFMFKIDFKIGSVIIIKELDWEIMDIYLFIVCV